MDYDSKSSGVSDRFRSAVQKNAGLVQVFGFHVCNKQLQLYQVTDSQVIGRDRKPGSVGYPSPNVDVVVVDDHGKVLSSDQTGEIAIKGQTTTLGYLGSPEANAKAFTSSGHFRTGDQSLFDKDGCLFLTGRLKEMINKGGESLSLVEIEIDNVLVSHETVAEAVSFAEPDEVYGEDIGAAIVLAKDRNLSESEVIAWLRDRVSDTKLPKTLWLVDAISVVEDLRMMWSDVLRIPASKVKDCDRFSVLSGDWGLAVRLAGMARTMNYTLSLASIFAHDELPEMATVMHTSKATDVLANGEFAPVDEYARTLCARHCRSKLKLSRMHAQ